MGQTKAGAVCMYVFVSVTYRNHCISVSSHDTDRYLCRWCLWVYSCEHMWVLPASECISVFKYEAESWSLLSAELNEADGNTCLTWNAIESNGPLITLHPHTRQPLLITYPSPNAHTHHPPPSTLTCPWNARHAVHQRSFPQWVCLHKLLKYPPSIHTLVLLHLHPYYMFSIILPSIFTINTQVSVMLRKCFLAIITGLVVECMCVILFVWVRVERGTGGVCSNGLLIILSLFYKGA